MSKILILANHDVGLYKFRKELIQSLLDLGYQVVIALPDGDLVHPLEEMGCRFIETPVDRRGVDLMRDLHLLTKYHRLMLAERPDLVITYTIKPNIYGGMISRLHHIPYAANITGLGTAFQKNGLLKRFVVWLYRIAMKKARVVFFENAENRDILQGEGVVRGEQICLLSGAGVNLEEYSYAEYPGNGKIHFLFVGRVMAEKGVDELFAAAERICSERQDVCFDIVGPMEDDYRDKVAALVQRDVIRYHGYQSDVRPYIRQSHCFVLPSWHEGMANTNLECASMGRPLITSDIHGCKEAVQDGITGYLCAKQDAESLYQAMNRFLSLSHEEKVQMGRMGRKHMEAVFDKKKVVEKTIEELQK